MPVSTVNLGALLGPEPQQDLAGTIAPAVQTGIQLATAKNQIEQKKIQVEQMKDELNMKKFNNVNSVLKNAASMNPKYAKLALPKIREQLTSLGADPNIADMIMSDDELRANYNAISGLLSEEAAKDPKLAGEFMMRLGSMGLTKEGIDLMMSNQRNQLQQKQAERQIKIMEQTAERDKKRWEREERTDLRLETTRLATESEKIGLPELATTLKNLDKEVGGLDTPKAKELFNKMGGKRGYLASMKLPFTDVMPLENVAIPEEAMPAYQTLASLRNAVLKARSGGAVTEGEAVRLLQELGAGGIRTGDQLMTGVKHVMSVLIDKTKSLQAGFTPEAVKVYEGRGGLKVSELEKLGSDKAAAQDPALEAKIQAAKAAGYSDAEIQAYIKKLQGGK